MLNKGAAGASQTIFVTDFSKFKKKKKHEKGFLKTQTFFLLKYWLIFKRGL